MPILSGMAGLTYTMRGIPRDLWHRVKVKTTQRRETIKGVILRLLEQYAKRDQ